MSDWLSDPQLFLYAKGTGPDDVILRRCKIPVSSSSSSLVVPMKSEDFDYVSNVKNHLELIDQFDWDETDYKRLIKYIYERLLLVNRQGLVFAEIYKPDDANLMVPIYIRSLDVLPLKPYIPNIKERLIPSRTVKYFEDVNGKAAAMMEEKDSNVITKLTARLDDLESKNKTLEGKVTKLTADLTRVWMNELTSSGWVGVEGLHVWGPYDDLIIVGSPGTFTVDDNGTNVRARYWYKMRIPTYNPDSANFNVVSLEDLAPNKEMARFSYNNWVSAKSKGKTYAIRGPVYSK